MCSFWKGYYFQKLIIFQLSRDQVGSEILKTKNKGISCNLIKRFLQNENKVILLTMVLLTQNFQCLWSLVDKNDSQVPKNDKKIRTLDITRNTPSLYHTSLILEMICNWLFQKWYCLSFKKSKRPKKHSKMTKKI